MNTNTLFRLADAAKNCGDYELANEIFAVLAQACLENIADIKIGYEQNQDESDIVKNLNAPDGAGYMDLPFLFDRENYLCIPLPLVSRYFRNHIVWQCAEWNYRERASHNRRHWRLQHDGERNAAARRDLRRRFYNEAAPTKVAQCVGVILKEDEDEESDVLLNASCGCFQGNEWISAELIQRITAAA